MGTLSKKVEYLLETKKVIKDALNRKGARIVESDSFRSYGKVIDELDINPPVNNQNLTVTENGVYSAESGYTGLAEVTVAVPEKEFKTQEKTANENGEVLPDEGYDGLSKVIVNVPQESSGSSSGSYDECIPLEIKDGVLQRPTEPFTWSSSATRIEELTLQNVFQSYANLTSVNLSKVTSIALCGMDGAFFMCKNLTSVNLSHLVSIEDNGLSSVCAFCSKLTSVDLSNLTSVGPSGMINAFMGCENLETIEFNNLSSISDDGMLQAFYDCTSLKNVSFPSLKSTSFTGSFQGEFNMMLRKVPDCTVHFPSNLESVIGEWSDVTSGFGGINTTVLFDLPATE
ncbi:MAG: leucine-rich repeat domain-containing protein [Candidatus Gastranaerophilales bacterium]|nr:leucine-rich repeat domain-containing protein [Candidatus Gastranaerophilales bacterium]MCM1072262.1 leucine-rich repeat domain-containing protein [Bacteroides sp.]